MKYKAFVTEDNVEMYDGGITQLNTDAATYFLNLIAGDNKTQTDLIDRGFFEKLENSFIETKGGLDVQLILGADKKDLSKMDNIVALEREGIPIHTVFHKSFFSDKYTASILLTVQELILNATKDYYEANTIKGCTKPLSANYDIDANFDDLTCNANPRELKFDGIFQTCVQHGEEKYTKVPGYNLCDSFQFVHPKTQGFQCSDGYEPILMFENFYETEKNAIVDKKVVCKSFLGFTYSCANSTYIVGYYTGAVTYHTYWCREKAGSIPNTELQTSTNASKTYFGGLFIKGEENVFTNTKGCPEYYTPYQFFGNVYVCFSKNSMGEFAAIPFGGFYSCQSVQQRCSPGFTGHFLKFHEGCAVYYCVRAKKYIDFDGNFEPLKSPPYTNFYLALNNKSETDAIFEKPKLDNNTIKAIKQKLTVTKK
uniref:Uncharacterized protein n=1 Tax=Panagrolaimus davidi TaxID=227884 RepID=A0A914P7R4_9BILA